MQAATIAAFGDVDVLNFGESSTPAPRLGHVLITIEAVGPCRRPATSHLRRMRPAARPNLNCVGASNVP